MMHFRTILAAAIGVFTSAALQGAASQESTLAVEWDGVQGPISGIATRQGDSTQQLKISTPTQECNGLISTPAGTWVIACPDGATASGKYSPRGVDQGGWAEGKDSRGKRVSFAASPSNQNTPAAKAPQPSAQAQQRPQTQPSPAPAVQQRAAAPPALRPVPGKEEKCGFLVVQGLPIQQGSVKCEPKSRTGDGGRGMSTADGATLVVRLEPNSAFLSLYAEKDVDGVGGFKTTSSDELRKLVESIGSKDGGKNYSALIPSPFRHIKFGIYSNGDWACAAGMVEGNRKAWGTGAHRAYAFVHFCQRGSHTVDDESLRTIANALKLD